MSVLNIVKMGHPILRKKALKVPLKDFNLPLIIDVFTFITLTLNIFSIAFLI